MRVTKWNAIPLTWREDVDQHLLTVLAENRQHIRTLGEKISRIHDLRPTEFLDKIATAWHYHNQFYNTLTDFVTTLRSRVPFGLREELVRIFTDMECVDMTTLFYSLAIKSHLDNWTHTRGTAVLPRKVFHMSYMQDHIDLLQGKKDAQDILRTYHAGCPQLLEQRLQRAPLKSITQTMDFAPFLENLSHNALYNLTLDRHEDIKSLVDISTIDNFDEYKHLYNLEGIEGFFLKDWIMNNTGTNLSGYAADPFLDALNKVDVGSGIARIPFHAQSTGVTCAAACAMQALHIFFGEEVSDTREREIFKPVASEHLPGSSFAKIAYYLKDKYPVLGVTAVHEKKALFKNVQKYGKAELNALAEYERNLDAAIGAGAELHINDIFKEADNTLNNGGLYIAATQIFGALHTNLVTGRNATGYDVYDPLEGCLKHISRKDLMKRMRTGIGQWGISLQIPFPSKSAEYQEAMSWFSDQHAFLRERGAL